MFKALQMMHHPSQNLWQYRNAQPQRGQAMVFVVGIMVVLLVAILLVFNTAQSLTSKRRLQNTVDAMTYSASVVMARNLNYLSYTNRAMAANEAGVAMAASLQTNTGAVVSTVSNAFEGTALIYGALAMNDEACVVSALSSLDFIRAIKCTIDLFNHSNEARKWGGRAKDVNGIVPGLAIPTQLIADALRLLNYGISTSQAAMYTATLIAIPSTIENVRLANDPDTEYPAVDNILNTINFATQYAAYIRPYTQEILLPGESGNENFKEVLRMGAAAKDSRDDYTKNRRILPNWLKSIPGAEWVMVNLNPLHWKGGTELVAQELDDDEGRIRWQSADAFYYKPFIPTPVSPTVALGEIPMPFEWTYEDYSESYRGRFTYGASAASQSSADAARVANTWKGKGTYGGLNDDNGNAENAGFVRATQSGDNNRDMLLNPLALFVLRFDSAWRYGKRTAVGQLTHNSYLAPFWDVTEHPKLVQGDVERQLEEAAAKSLSPLKLNPYSDAGPAITLTLRAQANSVRTSQVVGFSHPGQRVALTDVADAPKVLSSAQVHFRRPMDRWPRKGGSSDPAPFGGTAGYVEHRNLFSPYWHANNVQSSLWSRTLARGTSVLGGAAANSDY